MGRERGSFLDSGILPTPVVSAVDFVVDMAQFFFPSLFLASIDGECPSESVTLPECLLGLQRSWFTAGKNSVSDEPGDTFGFEQSRCAACACHCKCCLSRHCAESATTATVMFRSLVWRANIGTNTVAGLKGVSRDIVADTLGLAGVTVPTPPPYERQQQQPFQQPEKISDMTHTRDGDHVQVAGGGGAQSPIENSRHAAVLVASASSAPPQQSDDQAAYIKKLERRIRKLELVNQLVEDAYYEVGQQLVAERQSKIFMRKVMTLQHDQDMEMLVKSLKESMAASDDEDGKHSAFVIPGGSSDQEFSDNDTTGFRVQLGFQMERGTKSVTSKNTTPPASAHSSPILHTSSDMSPPPSSIRRTASDSTFMSSSSSSKVMLPGDLGIDFLTTAWEEDEEEEDSDVDVQFGHSESQAEEAVTDDNDDAWESEESSDDSDIDEDDDDAHELQIEFMSIPAHAIDAESSDDDADTEESDDESEASEDVGSDEDDHDITISFEGFHSRRRRNPNVGDGATIEWEIHSESKSEVTSTRRFSISDDEAPSSSEFDTTDVETPAPAAALATPRVRTPLWHAGAGAGADAESDDEAVPSDDGAEAVDPVKAVINRYYARTGVLDLAADIDDITVTEDAAEDGAESPDEDFIRRHTQRQRERDQSPVAHGDIMGIAETDGSVQERIATLPVDQRIAKFICRASSHLLQGARGGLNPGFMMNNIQELAAEFGSTHESVLCAFIESLYRLIESSADNLASDLVASPVVGPRPSALSKKLRDEIGSPLQAVMRIIKLFHAFISGQSDQDTVLRQLERLSLANQQ
ncbi:hypothetical protein FBU59_001155, partial [Linderina macrospora]